MDTSEDQNPQRDKEAEAVGGMLADAFIARVKRYPLVTQRSLLLACRERLLQDGEIARLLFKGE